MWLAGLVGFFLLSLGGLGVEVEELPSVAWSLRSVDKLFGCLRSKQATKNPVAASCCGDALAQRDPR